jgi:hypothetical protein
MYIGLHVEFPLFLSDFDETWVFSIDFRKNSEIWSFIKIRPVGAELYVDRRDEADSGFSQFIESA